MLLNPLALDLATQLIADRRARAARDALASVAAAAARSPSQRKRLIPRWNSR